MSDSQIEFSFKCPKCGATEISLPDDHTDESHATCKGCGVDCGPYGEIKKRAMDLAKKEVSKAFKTGMTKAGWKVK